MKVLVTGRGTSGSFQIRGVQLGEAIGATVERDAQQVKGFDLVVIVKRATPELLLRIRKAGVPVVWDVVDGWPQPHGNLWSGEECMTWLRAKIAELRPTAIVAATKVMQRDCKEFGLPVLYLPHHARPKQAINPIREVVQIIGYEGSESYLGPWREVLTAEAKRRGWEFVINSPSLADLDIVIAVREATGYAPRNWKSNVKLANAQGSGTPIVCNREAGCLETATGGEMFADTREELSKALDVLTDWDTRKTAANGLWPPKFHDLAFRYGEWLSKF